MAKTTVSKRKRGDSNAIEHAGRPPAKKVAGVRRSSRVPMPSRKKREATSDTGSSESGQENEGTSGDESSGEEAEVEADEDDEDKDNQEDAGDDDETTDTAQKVQKRGTKKKRRHTKRRTQKDAAQGSKQNPLEVILLNTHPRNRIVTEPTRSAATPKPSHYLTLPARRKIAPPILSRSSLFENRTHSRMKTGGRKESLS